MISFVSTVREKKKFFLWDPYFETIIDGHKAIVGESPVCVLTLARTATSQDDHEFNQFHACRSRLANGERG